MYESKSQLLHEVIGRPFKKYISGVMHVVDGVLDN
jgi:hypothetical protein